MPVTIIVGDALTELRKLPSNSAHCCVTSPPYWSLRDYKCDGQLGLEATPELYVQHLVEVFREVRRVLRPDGTLWLVLGDTYVGGGPHHGSKGLGMQAMNRGSKTGKDYLTAPGLKPKDLCMIPARVALALQQPDLRCKGCGAICHQALWGRFPNGRLICPGCELSKGHTVEAPGWWLRQDIIWVKAISGVIRKGSAMPESVRDRFCKSHEYIFLLTKSSRYSFDSVAVADVLDSAQSHKHEGEHEYEDLQQVQTDEADDLLQQERPAIGWSDGRMQGVLDCDSESMGSQIQQERQGQGDGDALLLFKEGAENEAGLSHEVQDHARTTGPIQSSRQAARKGREVQGPAAEIRQQREGKGCKSGTGQAVCQNGQGAVCQAQNGDQAQAPDRRSGLHVDAGTMDGTQGLIRSSVRVLQPTDGTPGNGPCDPAVEGRSARGGEYCSHLPDVQRPKGQSLTAMRRTAWLVSSQPFPGELCRSCQGYFARGFYGMLSRCKDHKIEPHDCGGKIEYRCPTCGTWNNWLSHFATYPPKLVEPCIKAGTSERGCCPRCGAPWRRVTKREQLKRKRPHDYVKRTGETGTGSSCANTVAGVAVETIGWQPTCKCVDGPAPDFIGDRPETMIEGTCSYPEPVPCTVLDPFAGAGTTGLVASRLGRDAILIELNPEYAVLARRRIDADAPLLTMTSASK